MKLDESVFERAKESTNTLKSNPWKGTQLESYTMLDPKNKGNYGEGLVIGQIIKEYGISVEKRTNPGHDAIIGGHPTEIKFSAATNRNTDYLF